MHKPEQKWHSIPVTDLEAAKIDQKHYKTNKSLRDLVFLCK